MLSRAKNSSSGHLSAQDKLLQRQSNKWLSNFKHSRCSKRRTGKCRRVYQGGRQTFEVRHSVCRPETRQLYQSSEPKTVRFETRPVCKNLKVRLAK